MAVKITGEVVKFKYDPEFLQKDIERLDQEIKTFTDIIDKLRKRKISLELLLQEIEAKRRKLMGN